MTTGIKTIPVGHVDCFQLFFTCLLLFCCNKHYYGRSEEKAWKLLPHLLTHLYICLWVLLFLLLSWMHCPDSWQEENPHLLGSIRSRLLKMWFHHLSPFYSILSLPSLCTLSFPSLYKHVAVFPHLRGGVRNHSVGSNFFFNVYFWRREREREHAHTHKWGRGKERKEDAGSKAGSVLTADSPMWRSTSPTVRSWPEPKSEA